MPIDLRPIRGLLLLLLGLRRGGEGRVSPPTHLDAIRHLDAVLLVFGQDPEGGRHAQRRPSTVRPALCCLFRRVREGRTCHEATTSSIARQTIARIFDQRLETIRNGQGIDWGTAEALALGTSVLMHQ